MPSSNGEMLEDSGWGGNGARIRLANIKRDNGPQEITGWCK